MKRLLLMIILAAFLVLTTLALWHHGFWGIIKPHFESFGAGQVLADLVIALSLFLVWMWQDAKKENRNPWFWLILTLAAGSIGALLYLLIYKTGNKANHASPIK